MTMWIPSAMTLIGPYRFSSRFASVWQNKRHFDSGDYHALLDTTLNHVNWAELNRELAARRAKGPISAT